MKILITTIDYSVIFRNEKALRGNKLIQILIDIHVVVQIFLGLTYFRLV